MNRGDLIYVLEHLRFAGFEQRRTIEIDRGVRDFILAALRRRP